MVLFLQIETGNMALGSWSILGYVFGKFGEERIKRQRQKKENKAKRTREDLTLQINGFFS